jgi:hypothetical protein
MFCSSPTTCVQPVRMIGNSRGRRVIELIVALWVLSLIDLGFTLWAHWFTQFTELNPLAGRFLHNDMVWGVVLMKVELTAVGALIFWRLRGRWSAEVALWAMVLVYAGLAVRWCDYAQTAPPAMVATSDVDVAHEATPVAVSVPVPNT